MKLLGYEIKDFTSFATIRGVYLRSDMRKVIIDWLRDSSIYNLEDCSADRETRHILKMFQDIKERTGATTIQMVEYFYSLERKIEELELTLEDFMNNSD